MSNDLLITPASRKLELKDSSGNVDAIIQTDGSGNLSITNTGGNITIGGASSNLFMPGNLVITGDINSNSVTDLDVTDKTITLGVGQAATSSGSSGIKIAGSNASILWDQTNSHFNINNDIDVDGFLITRDNVSNIDDLNSYIMSKTVGSFPGGTNPSADNATGIISMQTHQGNYFSQLALDTHSNDLHMRSAHNSTSWTAWKRFIRDGDAISGTTITGTGAITAVGGNINTNTGSNPFRISRLGATSEALAISVADREALFMFTQDESTGVHQYTFNFDSPVADSSSYFRFMSGQVGINDGVPSKGKIQINQQSNTIAAIQLTNSAQTSGNHASYPISIFFGDEQVGSSARHQASINAVREAWSNSPAALTFKTSATVNGATEKMRITSGGSVGIGTTTPLQWASYTDSAATVLQLADTSQRARVVIKGGNGAHLDLVDHAGGTNDKHMNMAVDGGILKFGSLTDAGSTFVQNNILVMDLGTGNVGIGTATPSGGVHLFDKVLRLHRSAGDRKLEFLDNRSGANHYSIEHDPNQIYFYNVTTTEAPFKIRNNGDLVMDAGNVGIGVGNSPAYKLSVHHATTNVVGSFTSGDNQVWINLNDDGGGTYGALLGHDSDAGHLFAVANNSVTKMFTIDDNGNVMIGNTGAGAKLDIRHDSGYAIRAENGSGYYFRVEAGGDIETLGSVQLQTDGAQLQFGADNDMQIFHNGANGTINNATGLLVLDAAGDIVIDADGGDVLFKDNNVEFGRILNTSGSMTLHAVNQDKDILFRGNDGGTTITALTLDMSAAGDATFNSNLYLSGSTTNYLSMHSGDLLRHNTGNGYIEIGPANTGFAHIQTDRTQFYFNRFITVDGGIFNSYDEDAILRRAGSSGHQITIGSSAISATLPFHTNGEGDSIGHAFKAEYYYDEQVGDSDGSDNKWTLKDANGTDVTSTTTNKVYRVRLVTLGTGTNTGQVYLADNVDGAGWRVKAVSVHTSPTESSNIPKLEIDGGVPKVSIEHTSNYNVRIFIEEYNTGNSGGMYTIFGTDAFATYRENGGHFGINRESPGQTLDIGGDVGINGTQIITTARNLTNIGSISSGAITSTGTGTFGGTITTSGSLKANNSELLQRNVNGWTVPLQTVLHSNFGSNLNDYLYIKVPGNSTSNHGIVLITDNAFYYGRDNRETGTITNDANAPFNESVGMKVSQAGQAYFKGKVGINTFDPDTVGYSFAEDLVINGGNSASDGVGITLAGNGKRYGVLAFGDAADNNAGEIWYDHNNNSLNFRTAGTQRVTIGGTGNVNIIAGDLKMNDTAVINNSRVAAFTHLTLGNSAAIGTDGGEDLRVGGVRGTFSTGGEGIHLYRTVAVGHPGGWGQGLTEAGIGGISVYGGCSLAYNNGNVMIGAANSAAIEKLDVLGKINVQGGGADWNTTTPGTTRGSIHIDPASSTDNHGGAITFGASDTSSGTTAQAGIYIRSDGNYGTKMYLATTDAYVSGSKVRMTINSNGNVGIGTASPSDKLSVSGHLSLGTGSNKIYNGSASDSAGMFFAGSTLNLSGFADIVLRASTTNVTSQTERLRVKADTGRVGIGTSSPSYKLHVSGDGYFSNELYAQTFENLQMGTATTPANTAGYFKIAELHRGAGKVSLSFTGGNHSPTTYIIQYYKNWSTATEVKLNQLGAAAHITKARIIEDTSGGADDGKFFLEIFCGSDSNGKLMQVYHQHLDGYYNPNNTVFTGTLATGTATGNNHGTEQDFVINGLTVERLNVTRINSNAQLLSIGGTAGTSNVGIGDTSPSYALEVNEASNYAGVHIRGSNAPSLTFGRGTNSTQEWKVGISGTNGNNFAISTGTGNSDRLIIDSNGLVGIGKSNSPDGKVHIVHNSTTTPTLLLESTVDTSDAGPVLHFKRHSSSPADADYIGQLKFQGENDADQQIVYAKMTGKIQDASDGTEDGMLEFMNKKAGANVITARLRSDSFQLINGTKFQVNNDTNDISTIQDNNGMAIKFEGADLHIKFEADTTEVMRLESNGKLHCDNDVVAFSTTISDERLKDKVVTIDNALNKVLKLRGVEYTWNDTAKKGKRDLGVIAQEVEEVLPEIVQDTKMALMNGEVYKTVDYEKMTGVLIEAMKEQQTIINRLEEKISDLEKKLIED